ncbi:MAG: hypothetical protein RLT30_06805, partial [Gammaproteobacteria bacterium]
TWRFPANVGSIQCCQIMYIAGRWSNRNLSRLELVVAIFAISVFFAVFSVYMLKVFAKVERVAVNTTVNNINVVLTSKLVEAIVKNDYSDIETVLDQNPYFL